MTIANEYDDITGVIRKIALARHNSGIPLESVTLQGISEYGIYLDIVKLGEVVPQVTVGGFDELLDVYRDSDNDSGSETSSDGDWASGDEEVVTAGRKVRLNPASRNV